MKHTQLFLFSLAALALGACSNNAQPVDETGEKAAQEFAARINGGKAATTPQPGSNAPKVAEPLPDAAPGPYVAGTATDPQAATCDANKMGPFIGRVANAQTRMAVTETVAPGREVRFLRPGGAFINPDQTNPRLNLMLDTQDIIRDARCG